MLVRILPLTENKQNLRVNFIEIKDRNFSNTWICSLEAFVIVNMSLMMFILKVK